VAAKFPNLPFGPMAVRHVLRIDAPDDERLIGWRAVQVPSTFSRALFRAALAMMPGVGPAALTLTGDRDASWRLLVITDRRLLLLRPSPEAPGAAVDSATGLGRLRATCPAEGRYDLDLGGPTPVTVLFVGRHTRGGRRLADALTALCGDHAPSQPEPAPERVQRSLTRAVAGTTAALARSSYGELLGRWPIDRQ